MSKCFGFVHPQIGLRVVKREWGRCSPSGLARSNGARRVISTHYFMYLVYRIAECTAALGSVVIQCEVLSIDRRSSMRSSHYVYAGGEHSLSPLVSSCFFFLLCKVVALRPTHREFSKNPKFYSNIVSFLWFLVCYTIMSDA
jgi:hypothetical protein